MIDEYLGHLLSVLERCATALETIAGKVSAAKGASTAHAEAPRAAIDPPVSVPPPPATNGSGKADEPAKPEIEVPVAYETLRLAVNELAKKKGYKLAMSMLEEFGVSTGKDIPPAQYAKALKRTKELLK